MSWDGREGEAHGAQQSTARAAGIAGRQLFLVNLTNKDSHATFFAMKTMQIGELKTHFSQVLEQVRHGEKIIISYGKSRENVAVIVPYSEYKGTNAIQLGLLRGKASYTFSDDFEMTAEELIGQ